MNKRAECQCILLPRSLAFVLLLTRATLVQREKGSRTSHTVSLPFFSLLFSSFFGNCRMERLPIPLPLIIPYTQQPRRSPLSHIKASRYSVVFVASLSMCMPWVVSFIFCEMNKRTYQLCRMHSTHHFITNTNKQISRQKEKKRKQETNCSNGHPPLLFYCSQCTSPDHKQGGMTETNKRHQGRKHRLYPFPLVDGHIFNNSFVDVFLIFLHCPSRLSIHPCRAMLSICFQSNPHKAYNPDNAHSIHTSMRRGELFSFASLPFSSLPFTMHPTTSLVRSLHPSVPPPSLPPSPNSPTPFLPSGISNGPSFAFLFPCCIPVFIYLFQPFFAILFFCAFLELRCFVSFVFFCCCSQRPFSFLLDPILDTDSCFLMPKLPTSQR